MKVTLVWEGEYEQRGVTGVFSSREAAIDGIKRIFAPPYQVTWREEDTEFGFLLVGDFEQVINYSTKHVAHFEFEEREVVGAAG